MGQRGRIMNHIARVLSLACLVLSAVSSARADDESPVSQICHNIFADIDPVIVGYDIIGRPVIDVGAGEFANVYFAAKSDKEQFVKFVRAVFNQTTGQVDRYFSREHFAKQVLSYGVFEGQLKPEWAPEKFLIAQVITNQDEDKIVVLAPNRDFAIVKTLPTPVEFSQFSGAHTVNRFSYFDTLGNLRNQVFFAFINEFNGVPHENISIGLMPVIGVADTYELGIYSSTANFVAGTAQGKLLTTFSFDNSKPKSDSPVSVALHMSVSYAQNLAGIEDIFGRWLSASANWDHRFAIQYFASKNTDQRFFGGALVTTLDSPPKVVKAFHFNFDPRVSQLLVKNQKLRTFVLQTLYAYIEFNLSKME